MFYFATEESIAVCGMTQEFTDNSALGDAYVGIMDRNGDMFWSFSFTSIDTSSVAKASECHYVGSYFEDETKLYALLTTIIEEVGDKNRPVLVKFDRPHGSVIFAKVLNGTNSIPTAFYLDNEHDKLWIGYETISDGITDEFLVIEEYQGL